MKQDNQLFQSPRCGPSPSYGKIDDIILEDLLSEENPEYWDFLLDEINGEPLPEKDYMPPTLSQRESEKSYRRKRLFTCRLWLIVSLLVVYLPWALLKVHCKILLLLGLALYGVMVVFTIRHREDVIFASDRKTDKLNMLSPLLLAAWLPALLVLWDFNFVNDSIFFWLFGFGVALLAVLVIGLPEIRKKYVRILWAIVISLGFGFSATGQINCLLDFTPPEQSQGTVIEKKIDYPYNGTTTSSITVTLPDGTQQDLKVSWLRYILLDVGDTLTVSTYQGGLGIPYRALE